DPVVSRQTLASHYATAAGLGAEEARADAVRLLLAAAADARMIYAHGLALRQAALAETLAQGDSERSQAAEAVGDARWMTEEAEEAMQAYGEALEHAEAAGSDPGDLARLRWKWVDMPTRWGSWFEDLPIRTTIADTITQGLVEARSARLPIIEGRLLVASALYRWRYESSDRVALEEGLTAGREALAIGERVNRPTLRSAAMDAIAVLLLALGRYAEARDLAARRLELALPESSGREERMDACSQAAQTRMLVGDYAGAVRARTARVRALPGALPAQRRPPRREGAGPGQRDRRGDPPAARGAGAGRGARAAARLRTGLGVPPGGRAGAGGPG